MPLRPWWVALIAGVLLVTRARCLKHNPYVTDHGKESLISGAAVLPAGTVFGDLVVPPDAGSSEPPVLSGRMQLHSVKEGSFDRSVPDSSNAWWWDPWAKLGLSFPLSIGREASVKADVVEVEDTEDVTEEVAEVRRFREEDQGQYPGQGNIGVNQACYEKMSENRRVFLMSLVHPFHGSTALMGILMSSRHLATLCSFNDWECEGRKILETSNDYYGNVSSEPAGFQRIDPNGPARVDDPSDAMTQMLGGLLDRYSEYWNLSRQVLFDKSPHLMLHVEAVHRALQYTPLPQRMVMHGIQHLDTAYVMMWRPFCLRLLSRHERDVSMVTAAFMELSVLERSVSLHKWLVRRELPVLVINLAKLIWQSANEKHRLKQFLPCLRHLDEDYVPRLGLDIFPGNQWKANGSVKSFGESVDPATIGFERANYTCTGQYRYNSVLDGADLEKVMSLQEYLDNVSSTPPGEEVDSDSW